MKTVLIITAFAFLFGCGEYIEKRKAISMKRAEKRIELFSSCMELAAKNSRRGDDDVSDLISECDNVSYYTANQLIKQQ